MKTLFRLLFALSIFTTSLWATTPVTGSIQSLNGSPITSGVFVRFWLRGCSGGQPRVNGIAILGPTQGGSYYFDFLAGVNGAVSGVLYSTRDATGLLGGDIDCGGIKTGVWYGMQIFQAGKGGAEVSVQALQGITLNISTVVPIITTPIIPSVGDAIYARLDSANQPFVNSIDFMWTTKTVATLPSAAASTGRTYRVTDGFSLTDCSLGNGANSVICTSNGNTWTPIGTGGVVQGGGGSGTVDPSPGSHFAAVYLGPGTTVDPAPELIVNNSTESSLVLNDNTAVSGPTSGMKFASVGGTPTLWFGATNLGAIMTGDDIGVVNGIAGLNGVGVVPITQLASNSANCTVSTALLGNNTCGSLPTNLPTVSPDQILAGPSAYGASAAVASARALAPQDLPAAGTQCPLDNAICSGAVDGNGNPNFLATSANLVLPINGGATPLVLFIGGKYQTLTTNVTTTLPGTAGIYFIYVTQDTTNTNLLAADFGSTTIAPTYAKVPPTKLAAATGSNPQFWFDLSTNLMRANTAGTGGTFVATPALILGAVDDTASAIDNVLCEPFFLDPHKRFNLFKDAADGSATITSGTTSKTGEFHYSAFEMTGGTYQPNGGVFANVVFSQNVIILDSGATFGGAGTGVTGASTSTGNGLNGPVGGFGGSGGGGGGGTGKTGGTGGVTTKLQATSQLTNGAAGGAAGANNGNAGASSFTPNYPTFAPSWIIGCTGAGGAGGGGDATNPGGAGGNGGSYEHIIAPAVLIAGTAKVQADGATPATPGAGNVGGGGGGGGGCAIIHAAYVNGTTANVTANGATGGASFGSTVGTGGAGGNGVVKIQPIL